MRSYLHVILFTLFIMALQGCSSNGKNEQKPLLETPQIETTTSSNSTLSELVVRGEVGALVYLNGKHVGTIGEDGTAHITLEIPQNQESAVQTLVLKDKAGNTSEEVVFTLNPQTSENNTTQESEHENNSSSDINSTVDENNDTTVTENNATTSKPTPPSTGVATLQSLKLTANKTTLNKDTNTTLNVIATFSDNSTKEVTDQVTWSITPTDALKIQNQNLQAVQDGNITLQAKLGNTSSNVLHVNVFWEINGYRLPPEPDPKVNNATLLGVDVNNNGVRDDVERWIYETYKNKHPIHVDIALQAAKAYKKVLQEPERALEIREEVSAPFYCGWYYQHEASEFNDPILVQERINKLVKSRYFNIKERTDIYWQYDTLLSGGAYTVPWADEMKQYCDFNTSRYDEE